MVQKRPASKPANGITSATATTVARPAAASAGPLANSHATGTSPAHPPASNSPTHNKTNNSATAHPSQSNSTGNTKAKLANGPNGTNSAGTNTTAGGSNSVSPVAVTAARATFVDLSKLRKTSLKRYKKHFKLDVKADSKVELLAAVSAHFAAMPVREADVALEFHEFARTQRNKQQRVETGLVENAPAAR